MYISSYFNKAVALASIILLVSCDKDFNEIGGNLVDQDNFNFEKYTSNVIAYNEATGPVTTNNLPINALGIFEDGVFGTTTANFVTQVSIDGDKAIIDPTKNQVVESVVLTIPYFIKTSKTVTSTNGSSTYELDSIHGPSLGRMKLNIYRSGYFLRNLDPASQFLESQNYYSDQNNLFFSNKIGARLNNNTEVAQNDAFFFDAKETSVETPSSTAGEKPIITYIKPQMKIELSKTEFQNILVTGAQNNKFSSNDAFIDYFRGLYFEVEKINGQASNMAMLNFAGGKITIKYKEDFTPVGSTTPNRVDKEIKLNLAGNTVKTVSLLQNTPTVAYSNALNAANVNTTAGNSKLYLKGGEGSMAIIKLFSPTELQSIRDNNWLINEAKLVFHIDAATMANGTTKEPRRILLFDATNNKMLVDYNNDSAQYTSVFQKLSFGGIIKKEEKKDGRGLTYSFKITDHIRNLLKNKELENVTLGLAVTENVGYSTFSSFKNTSTNLFKKIPLSSVMNPLGTVLYGGTTEVEEAKRLKLEIYYTKSK